MYESEWRNMNDELMTHRASEWVEAFSSILSLLNCISSFERWQLVEIHAYEDRSLFYWIITHYWKYIHPVIGASKFIVEHFRSGIWRKPTSHTSTASIKNWKRCSRTPKPTKKTERVFCDCTTTFLRLHRLLRLLCVKEE